MSEKGWLAWVPGYGETREEALAFWGDRHTDPEEAAEYWAEHHSGFSGDPFNSIVVCVAVNVPGSPAFEVEIDVESEPVFVASHARRLP